jgi:hypothetical protein
MKKNLPAAEPYLMHFDEIGDPAIGFLITTQQANKLPFAVKRVFWVYNTPTTVKRGGHANKITQEIMIAVHGSVTVQTESGSGQIETFELKDPKTGLFIPDYCWLTISFSPGAVLVCLASTDFDETDYILDLEEFRKMNKNSLK